MPLSINTLGRRDSLPIENLTRREVPGPLPYGEQSLPLDSTSVPYLLGPTSGEPQCERSMNQAPRVPRATSQVLNSGSSGTSGAPITPPAMPSGQQEIPPDGFIPSGTPRLQPEVPASAINNQIADEACVELVVPDKGPTTGGTLIVILGRNFPAAPLYVWFGGNSVRAVSLVRYYLS